MIKEKNSENPEQRISEKFKGSRANRGIEWKTREGSYLAPTSIL